MNDWVHDALFDWGLWARGHRLNTSTASPLARMMAMGALPAMSDHRYNDSPGFIPPDIESIERAVAQVGLQSRRLRRIIMRFYVSGWTIEQLATYEHTHKETVESWLHDARGRVASQIKLPEAV